MSFKLTIWLPLLLFICCNIYLIELMLKKEMYINMIYQYIDLLTLMFQYCISKLNQIIAKY